MFLPNPLRRLFVVVLTLATLAMPAAASSTEVVATLHEALIESMRASDRLAVTARYEQLEPVLAQAFDFEVMARAAAASAWRKASPAERANLIAAFGKMSTATYANRFTGYNGHSFETLGSAPGPRNTVLVSTQLIIPGDAPVPLTYVTIQRDGRWRIVDVILDQGISELAVKRSEYSAVLASGGASALTEVLEHKAAELLAH